METWELAAREAIRDLVARYNQYGDRARFDPMLALFAEDAVLELVPDRHYAGHAAIRGFFEAAVGGGVRVLRHMTATHQIDVSGPYAARGRCYFAVLTENGLDHWGSYRDEYRCTDGTWRFASRRVRVDAVTPGGWADQRQRGDSDTASDRALTVETLAPGG